ncbi:hypothetical protein AY601_0866 [Pedobacter cryoconitis]|uniref:Uncharacterized protein n=1 Tax=Pedobacter cryoconitis TaxID=188932 RepID=A0A127V9A3_9SPHI|nr:hypothetical protein AY601_0866 [Pedobacter cryoconitis]
MARFWYAYNGIGDPFLSGSYNLLPFKPVCINGCTICAIYSPGSSVPSSPLSTNLRTYIVTVMANQVAQPDSSANIKKYVYGKVGC